jgi:hypothetical protein
MPATLESPASETEGSTQGASQATNPFIFNAPLRTAHLLSHAELMSDKQLTEAGWLKRITRAIARDYKNDRFDDDTGLRIARAQEIFRKQLALMDYTKLVNEGAVNKLVENYLEALATYHQGKLTKLDTLPLTDPEQKEPSTFNRIHDREKALAGIYQA